MAFGCSFTAGAELLDHEVNAAAEKIKRKKGIRHWNEQYRMRDLKLHLELAKREGLMAWPAHMAKIMGVDVVNRALGGASLAHAVDQLERAWYGGELDERTLVVVGITTENRLIRWIDGAQTSGSWMLNYDYTWPKKWHRGTVLEVMDERYLMHLHTGYMLRLVQIGSQIPATLRMFDMFDAPGHVSRHDHVRDRWREIMDSGMTCFDRCMNNMIDHGERLGGGHPRVEAHQRFAQWAVTQIPSC